MRLLITAWLLVPFVAVIFPGNTKAGDTEHKHFDRTIAPLLAQHCLSCHSGVDPKGELDLSTQESAMRGGESGVVIVPGELDASPLWQYVESDEMPPKKPLSSAEKETLKAWIVAGAKWGTKRIDPFRYSTDARAGVDWWSLQPLQNPEPPSGTNAGWTKIAIDAFVDAKRTAAGLEPSPEADRRTLIRRLSFDLLGLPPTPQQLDLFLSDNSANAYETLVDRMLESPHYGERWARHWLDIVRFGESNGFEYDQPRDNAWHYRNWVINALNDDMPYDEFVRLQLAGDLIRPNDLNAVAAAGFLVAGPHNTTLPANDKMRMSMAQDEMEDLVGIVGQTFLGLTINCSRCHDHKFDPISQKEYYQFAATLSGVTHGERNVAVPLTKTQQQRLADIEKRSAAIQRELTAIELPARESILLERKNSSAAMPEPPQPLAIWEFDEDFNDRMGDLHGDAIGGAKIEDGCLVLDGTDAFVATKPLGVDLTEKTLEAWVQLTNDDQRGGGVISVQALGGGAFDAIVFGEREPKKWMAGSNSFVRTQPFNGPEDTEATQRFVHMAIVYQKDGTIIGYRDGQTYGNAYRPGELQFYAAGQSQVVFGMRHSPAGGNRMLAGRIQRAQLYARALASDEVAASAGVANLNYVSTAQLLARLTAKQRSQHEQLNAESAALQAEKESMTKSQQVSLYLRFEKSRRKPTAASRRRRNSGRRSRAVGAKCRCGDVCGFWFSHGCERRGTPSETGSVGNTLGQPVVRSSHRESLVALSLWAGTNSNAQ